MKKGIIWQISLSIIFLFNSHVLAALESTPVKRIVSLGPALTEQIYLLGAEDKIAGVTTYCQRPAQAQEKEKVGTVIEADLEKIISLKPDLVLTTSLTPPKTKEKLKNLRITVVDFPQAKSFQQLCEQFLKLARLVNKEKVAKEIVQTALERIDTIKERVSSLPKPKVFIQIGAKPLYTVNADSFINDFIDFGAGINIAQKSQSGLYSREEVLKNNPDIIIISTMGIIGEKEKKIWQRYKTLKAVRNNRVYIIDSYRLCSPTPQSFVETLEEITDILHSEKIKNR